MVEVEDAIAAAVGQRLRGGLLVEQAGAIKTLALSEMALFKQEKLLDDPDLVAVDEAIAKVVRCLQDRAIATSETHQQTVDVSAAMEDLKAERKRLMECVLRLYRHRPELLQFRQGSYQGSSVSGLCTDVNRKIAFAREREAELSRVGAGKDFLDRVEAKVRALEASSGAQEAALVSLPQSTRDFYIAKGRLYFVLKDILSAARALHVKDPERAAMYSLKVLHRQGAGKNKPEPAPVPTK